MLQINLYTKPGCMPCKAAKRKFDELDVIYNEVNVIHDSTAANRIQQLGYSSVPVTEVTLGDGASWSWPGYAPSQIERLYVHLEGYDPEAST